MRLGLTLTWLFTFPDAGLAGRIGGGASSGEAGMVDKGQLAGVTESHAKSRVRPGSLCFSNSAVGPPTGQSLVGTCEKCRFLSCAQIFQTRVRGVAQKFAFFCKRPGGILVQTEV